MNHAFCVSVCSLHMLYRVVCCLFVLTGTNLSLSVWVYMTNVCLKSNRVIIHVASSLALL